MHGRDHAGHASDPARSLRPRLGAVVSGTRAFPALPRSRNFAATFGGAIHSVGGSLWRKPKGWNEVTTLEGMGPIVDHVGGVDDLGRIIAFGGHDSVSGDIGSSRAYLPSSGTTEDLPSPMNHSFDFVGCAVDGQHRARSIGGGNGLKHGQFGHRIGSENRWKNLAYLPYTCASVAAPSTGSGRSG